MTFGLVLLAPSDGSTLGPLRRPRSPSTTTIQGSHSRRRPIPSGSRSDGDHRRHERRRRRDTLTVDYSTFDGTASSGGTSPDYRSASGTLTFPRGARSRTFVVPIVQDTSREGTETVRLELSNPENVTDPGHVALGSAPTATLDILDDEGTIQFASKAYSASEGAGRIGLAVRRTGTVKEGATVWYVVTGGTAVRDIGGGGDYALAPVGLLSFPPGEPARPSTSPWSPTVSPTARRRSSWISFRPSRP